jgi:hypothetical protein
MSMNMDDVLLDPDFISEFQRIQVTGTFTDGVWSTTETPDPNPYFFPVLPARLDQLQVLPEGLRNNASIGIYTNFELYDGQRQDDDGRQPDIIIYQGGYYKVALTKQYSMSPVYFSIAQRFQRGTQ